MAIFRLAIQSVGRTAGRRATSSAAYRAGERIRDERSGNVYDHSDRTDVLHKEIILPTALSGTNVSWAKDRSTLWNQAEHAERRRNSRVAREYQVSLPSELSSQQRLELTREFSRHVADRYQVAVDMAIHAPRPHADPRSYHAHLLTTTREITPAGLGDKASIELWDTIRLQRGLLTASNEYKAVRELWAGLANEAFRQASLDARIDHRSLGAQGLEREPGPSIPHRFVEMERKGIRTTVADQIRENYRRRVESHEARAAARRDQTSDRKGLSLEDIRREAREAWLQFRAQERSNESIAPSGRVQNRELASERREADTGQQRAAHERENDFGL